MFNRIPETDADQQKRNYERIDIIKKIIATHKPKKPTQKPVSDLKIDNLIPEKDWEDQKQKNDDDKILKELIKQRQKMTGTYVEPKPKADFGDCGIPELLTSAKFKIMALLEKKVLKFQ